MSATRRVLVAEDEEAIARLIQFKLSKAGFEVVIASDGEEALGQLSQGGWSLAVLDVMMPAMDGWEVLRRARSVSHAGNDALPPVIMLTARSWAADEARAAGLGVSRVLRKPFDPSELAAVARECVGEGPWNGDDEWASSSDGDSAERAHEEFAPERLREEFIDSLSERLESLRRGIRRLAGREASAKQAAAEIQELAHKIAGTGGSLGFKVLARISGELDDTLAEDGDLQKWRARELVQELEGAIESTIINSGSEPPSLPDRRSR